MNIEQLLEKTKYAGRKILNKFKIGVFPRHQNEEEAYSFRPMYDAILNGEYKELAAFEKSVLGQLIIYLNQEMVKGNISATAVQLAEILLSMPSGARVDMSNAYLAFKLKRTERTISRRMKELSDFLGDCMAINCVGVKRNDGKPAHSMRTILFRVGFIVLLIGNDSAHGERIPAHVSPPPVYDSYTSYVAEEEYIPNFHERLAFIEQDKPEGLFLLDELRRNWKKGKFMRTVDYSKAISYNKPFCDKALDDMVRKQEEIWNKGQDLQAEVARYMEYKMTQLIKNAKENFNTKDADTSGSYMLVNWYVSIEKQCDMSILDPDFIQAMEDWIGRKC